MTGVAGGDTRFQVFARLYNVVHATSGITLKADLDDGRPARSTRWVPLFRGADWHEREAWEMYGFDFDRPSRACATSTCRREFEGHPLRKDFPLLARDGQAVARAWSTSSPCPASRRRRRGGDAAEEG